MRTLYNATPSTSGGGKRLVTVEDGTHNDTWEKGGSAYLKALDVFINEVRVGWSLPPPHPPHNVYITCWPSHQLGVARICPVMSCPCSGEIKVKVR